MSLAAQHHQHQHEGAVWLTDGAVHRVLLRRLGGQDDARLVALLHIDLGLPGALRLQDAGALAPLGLGLSAQGLDTASARGAGDACAQLWCCDWQGCQALQSATALLGVLNIMTDSR